MYAPMLNTQSCHVCGKAFSRPQRLKSHLNKKIPCKRNPEKSTENPNNDQKYIYYDKQTQNNDQKNSDNGSVIKKIPNILGADAKKKSFNNDALNDPNSKPFCFLCNMEFSNNSNLNKHMRRYHDKEDKIPRDETKVTQRDLKRIEDKISQLVDQINRPQIIQQHQHNNQILQVMCVSGEQNYLDILAEKWGFDNALDYIRGCALSDLTGDCRLLEKIYFEAYKEKLVAPTDLPIKYTDKGHTKIEYLNEKREKVIDQKGSKLIKKLANNLQNSYLKGVNYVINVRLSKDDKLKDYDIHTWNRHIYTLSDEKYQKKLLANLDIPDQSEH